MAALLGGLIRLAAQGRRSSALAADGTLLTLEAVTYGKVHRHASGPFWKRLLQPLAPVLPRAVRPPARGVYTFTNDMVCFWVHHRFPTPGTPSITDVLITDDEAGSAQRSAWTQSQMISPTETVVGYGFTAFPRRARKLRLDIQQYVPALRGRKLVATFEAANPARGPFPAWQPEPLPQTRTNGPFEFTLTRLVSGCDSRDRRSKATNLADCATLAGFRVSRQGVPDPDWSPVNLWAWDATGNSAASSSWSSTQEKDEAIMCYQWGLWPDEPAWKLRVEFSRSGGFAREELWTVVDIPFSTNVPNYTAAPAEAFATTHLSGSVLRLFPPCQPAYRGDATAQLLVTLDLQPEGWRLNLVGVRDDQGRQVGTGSRSWGGGQYRYELKTAEGVKQIAVTLAYHQSRFAEFMAKPTRR